MKNKFMIFFTIVIIIAITVGNYNLNIKGHERIKAEQEIPIAEVENLLDLNDSETEKLNEFKANYDDQALLGVEPISICKMYLYSSYIGDYETEYELYTTEEDYVMSSKEEYDNIPEEHRKQGEDFKIFQDIYNLNVEYRNDDYGERAIITWSSNNGYYDDQGAWEYFFNLTKDDDIWKVSFVPMQ